MSIKIRMRGKARNGVAEVKALIKHPMESGLRKNKATGKNYPAHFITDVAFEVNGKAVINSEWSGSVSANPYVAVKIKAAKGDKITIALADNTGAKGTHTLTLK